MANTNDDSDSSEVTECLRKLCTKICPDEAVAHSAYRLAVACLSDIGRTRASVPQEYIRHRIQERLLKLRSASDVDKFTQHYEKIKTSAVLTNPTAVLEFLYALSPRDCPEVATQKSKVYDELYNANLLNSFNAINMNVFPSEPNQLRPEPSTGPSHKYADSMSGSARTMTSNVSNNIIHDRRPLSNRNDVINEVNISERELIQEVLYAAQGIGRKETSTANGQLRGREVLVARISELGFLHDQICLHMDPSSGCTPIVLYDSICFVTNDPGFAFRHLQAFHHTDATQLFRNVLLHPCDKMPEDAERRNPGRLVGQGLISAFRNELTEYYRSLAILQSELNSSTPSHSAVLTLRRLAVWAIDPLHRLKWLATIGYASQNKKGGDLATCVHRFLSHGDPRVISLVHQLLAKVCYPLYVMLCRWLLDGEIEDPFNEFFIESRPSITTERLWHDKYRVREAMLPAFISKQQALHILATGKSVTFLREVCDHKGEVAGRESLKRVLDKSSVELLFSGGPETKQHAVMSKAYLGVSRCLLDNLLGPHKLLQHLQALHGYLLLGQGDFIRMLMVLLEPELDKNANKLYVHNLTGILESAIRASNAQYDDLDILNRLYVNLFTPSSGDTGWDVFSLFYRVDGPLGTVLEPEAIACYRTLFMHLWRAKRMEHTLGQMWKHHTVTYKTCAKMSEVMPLFRQLQILRSEMAHLVKELQYALFVVVECAWHELQTGAKKAQALDDLLAAHNKFLAAVTSGALLDNTTKQLQPYIRNVYDEILSLRDFSKDFFVRVSGESERRKGIDQLNAERTKRGEYGVTIAEENRSKEDFKVFVQYLSERKADLNVLSRAYRSHVKTFILQLALQNEVNLQFLLFRLDYNEFYKSGDSKLHEPLTYQHKRLSLVDSKMNRRMADKHTKRVPDV